MSYSNKLRDPRWQKKRLEILNRDQFKCCLCEDDKTELHVHHLKYKGEPWDAPNESLQTLCAHCHSCVSIYSLKPIRTARKQISSEFINISFLFLDGSIAIFATSIEMMEFDHIVDFSENSKTLKDIINLHNISHGR